MRAVTVDVDRLMTPATPTSLYLSTLTPGGQETQFATLGVIARHLDSGLHELEWHQLEPERLVEIRRWMLDKYAPATANRALAGIRSIIKIAWLQGLIDERSCKYRLSFLKSSKGNGVRRGRMLEPSEIEALMHAAATGNEELTLRDRAILAVMFEAGLRRAEVCSLDLENYKNESLHVVKGKNLKSRVVPLDRARAHLDAWIRVRGDWTGPLFCTLRPRSGRISAKSVRSIIRRITRRARVAHWTPHDGRRTYISTLLATGSDPVTVAALAGHSSPTVTMTYDKRPQAARVEAVARLQMPL